jgi:ABC-type Zn uptake system ZnuABC Zn-binding protein ZnuA
MSAGGLVALSLPACAPQGSEGFKVVTTFTIIADMARNVAGDAAVVESVTKAGAEIHNYQPTPGDLVKAQDADLILWNGLNLEQWFEQFFGNLSKVPSAVVSEGVEPIGIGEGPYSGRPNPHAWMSPAAGPHLCREHPQGDGPARSRERTNLWAQRESLQAEDRGHRRADPRPAGRRAARAPLAGVE